MTRDTSPRTDDLRSSPRPLHLLDSAGKAEALKPLAAARGITLQVSAPATPAPDSQRAICLQSVPATADAHWFSHVDPHHVPVRFHLPQVAELVITPAQDEARCTAAADALMQLGLQVLLAPARPGLLVDRIRHACLNEALALLGEGVPAAEVEKAGVDAGLVSGPLALLDAQGLGVTDALYHQTLDGHGCCGHAHDHHHGHGHDHTHHHHVHEHDDDSHGSSCADQGQDDGHHHHHHGHHHDHEHHEHHHHAHRHHDHAHHHHAHEHHHGHDGDAPSWPAMTDEAVYVMEKMAHGFQRKGGAPGQGFYSLDDDDDLELWSGLSSFVRRSLKLPADDARDRLRFITAVEVLQALDSRAAGNAATIEMASAGTGLWADAAHGPVAFIRSQDADTFAARAAELAQAYGPRFALPDNWQKLLPG